MERRVVYVHHTVDITYLRSLGIQRLALHSYPSPIYAPSFVGVYGILGLLFSVLTKVLSRLQNLASVFPLQGGPYKFKHCFNGGGGYCDAIILDE
jgi:hypothetical protein